MNWLYYNGRFGSYNSTCTIPWGTGPVLTAGKPCIGADKKGGATDILYRKGSSELYGLFVNIHEPVRGNRGYRGYSGSPSGAVASVVHQFDR